MPQTNLVTSLKNYFRPLKRKVFRPLDFPRSLKRLREVEAAVIEKGESPIEVPVRYRGHGEFQSIRAAQLRFEISGFFEQVKAEAPKYVCEIGTALGGTFYLWCQAAREDGVLVSMDILNNFYSPNRREFYSHFGRGKQKTHFLVGDSHAKDSLEKLTKILDGKKLDFLFIDGDHTDAGVRKDFEMYSPLVRPGGMIGFHDILSNPHNPRNQVHPLWNELKKKYPKHREIIETDSSRDEHASCVGIGIIWV